MIFIHAQVEIGGDGQGTCGSEASHMRGPAAGDANFSRGFAWWLISEAKRRNPEIVTYALPESWPVIEPFTYDLLV